jgi:hypothetical protein
MAAVQKPKARKVVWSASQIARLVVGSGDGAAAPGDSGPSSSSEPPGSSGTAAALSHHTAPRRRLLNPLVVPGLLMSALVTCAYASQTSACSSCCSPSAAAAAFNLFTAADEDPELVMWKSRAWAGQSGSQAGFLCVVVSWRPWAHGSRGFLSEMTGRRGGLSPSLKGSPEDRVARHRILKNWPSQGLKDPVKLA